MARKTTATPKVTEEGKRVEVKCAFCQGTGKDPFTVLSLLSNCPVCGGQGKIQVKEPYERCGACEGTGVYFRSKLYCWPCRGKGVVTTSEPL